MRVTNLQTTAMVTGGMNRNGVAMARLHEQMSSGLRLQKPSDDPVASIRVLRIQREESALVQYNKNIANLQSSLSAGEAGLRSASSALLNIRDLALWASNGSNTAEDLRAMASELESLEETLVALFNSRDEEGRYRYSGTLTDRPAVTYDAATGQYTLTGNDEHRQAAVANGVMLDENVSLQDFLGADAGLLNDLHALVGMLKDPLMDPSDPALQAHLATFIGTVDSAHGAVMATVTDLGGRQNNLSLLSDGNEDASIVNQTLREQLTSLDYARATVELSLHELAIHATQKTYLKINNLSLFNLL